MPDDLGFEKLLQEDGLVAGLLGKSRKGRNRPLLYGPDLPVVVLTGGPGMGKGRLLGCIRSIFGAYVPVAWIDCGAAVFRRRAEEHPGTRSECTEALREIGLQFQKWDGDGGGIKTPRLYAGLAAIAASDGQDTTGDLMTEVRRHDALVPKGSFWRGVFHRARAGYLNALLGLVTNPLTAPVVVAVVDELLARLSHEGTAALRGCYGAYPGAAGMPRLGLHTLANDFQQGGAARRTAEGFLFRALREDVEAAYGGFGGLAHAGRPALLLDRADTVLGRNLVRPVLTDREHGHHDRLVVVATARHEGGGRLLGRERAVGEDRPTAWAPSDGPPPNWRRPPAPDPDLAPPARGVVLVRMPVLTREQQQEATTRLRVQPSGTAAGAGSGDPTTSWQLVDFGIHRLSGGRPLFVTRLGEATASYRPPAGRGTPALLDGTVRTGDDEPPQPVGDVLVDELVLRQLPEELPPLHHDQWLDLLSHLSVAHDVDCAQALMLRVQAGRAARLSAYRIAELLQDSGWPHCPRHFIGDLGLRTLLRQRLYRMRPDGAAWARNHEQLRHHYHLLLRDQHPDPVFGSAGAHRLNHQLAHQGAEPVVNRLTSTFATTDPRLWCADVLSIAQAPLLGRDDDRRARALGEVQTEGGLLHWRVDRLLHALWLCEDRTRPIDEAVADALKDVLDDLCTEAPRAAAVLTDTARRWGELIENRQPLKPCACTRHIGRKAQRT
ncbi:hypothetical protein ACIBL6_21260 [Streptomyces sp. NPDC050400]|uniref:hypothetical protein n=1 Tax=Streptomyces sp. NPDC050400 TaxID=3365610 RepID=UPI0037929533